MEMQTCPCKTFSHGIVRVVAPIVNQQPMLGVSVDPTGRNQRFNELS
jgi:hypothetical protein